MLTILSEEESARRDEDAWQKLQPGTLCSYYESDDLDPKLVKDGSWRMPDKRFGLVLKKNDSEVTLFELSPWNRQILIAILGNCALESFLRKDLKSRHLLRSKLKSIAIECL